MFKPFYNEEAVKIGDDTIRLVINFRAMDATESLVGRNYDEVLKEMAAGDPPLSLQGKVVWGLLREHHPDLSLDHAMTLLFGEPSVAVGFAMNKLLNAAFPAADPEAKGKNPTKPRGASKPSTPRGAVKV